MLSILPRTARWLALFLCACRAAPPSSGDPAPPLEPAGNLEAAGNTARAGTTIRTAHYQLRASLPEPCAPSGHGSTSASTRRIGIEFVLEPTSDVQVPANPYYARLVDSEHNVYEATLGGCGAPLTPPLPARGQTARGRIVFELPRAARPVTLLYAPELVGVAKTESKIDVQRRSATTLGPP